MKKKTVSIVVWIVSAVIALTVGVLALTEECAHVYTTDQNDGWVVVTEATCTKEGEKTRRCTRCGKEETGSIKKKEHVVGKVETTKKQTCTQDGIETTYCKVCNNVMNTETLTKLEHAWKSVKAAEATCLSVGYTAHEVCEYGCGTKRGYVESPKLEHDWESVEALAATCTSTGYTAHETCTRGCGTKRGYELIPMHMSTTAKIEAVEHTCEEAGSTEGLRCTECLAVLVKPTVIPASHDLKPDGWTVVTEATCLSVGAKTQVCAVCTLTVQEDIPMTGHSFTVNVLGKEPTCTGTGYTAHKICANCGAQDSSYKALGLLSHKFIKGICNTCETNIFEYELREDGYWLIGVNRNAVVGTGYSYDLELPASPDENDLSKMLVGIEYRAAYSCSFITSIVLPDTVKTIEDGAFDGCSSLKTINLDNVKSIGRSAFSSCSSLTTVTLTDKTESIGLSAFDGCTSLRELTVPFLGTAYESGNTFGEIFGGNRYAPESLKTVIVLALYDNVIPANAFSEVYAVQTINLPQGVISVGESAFKGCGSLSTVKIGSNDSNVFEGVTAIGANAFTGTKIIKITLPFLGESESATENKTLSYAFGKAEDMIVENVTILKGTELSNDAFKAVASLKTVILPAEVVSIGANAFNGCGNLTQILHKGATQENYFPETVTSIGSLAFAETKLAKITLPFIGNGTGDYVNIGYAFGDNQSMPSTLTEVTILESSQTVIYADAFKGCKYLTKITLPNNITAVNTGAFENCEKLQELALPESVETMGANVFKGCKALTTLTVPFLGSVVDDTDVTKTNAGYLFEGDNASLPATLKSLTVLRGKTVAEEAFAGCANLSSIVIADETEIIGKLAFKGCVALTEFVAPESVKYIKSSAFSGCVGLTKITLPFVGMTELDKDEQENKIVIGQKHFGYIFDGDSTTADQNASIPVSLKTVVLTSATKIVNQAFYGCTSIESVTLPSTLTSLGEEAFKGCTALKQAEFQKVENVDWTLTKISDGAFAMCSALEGIVLPASVEEIGALAFGVGPADSGKGCVALTEIYTEGYDALRVKKIGYQAFMGAFVSGEEVVKGIVTPAQIKVEGIEEMGAEAFCYSNIGSVEISGTLTDILSMSFYGCKNLETVVLPTSVTKLEANAFRNNPKMNKIVSNVEDLQDASVSFKLPNLSSIGAYAFRDCVAITGKIEFTTAVWMDGSAFENCTGLTEVVFNAQEGKTSIGQNAFNGCTNLEWVYLNYKNVNEDLGGGRILNLVETGVVSIGNYAFENCGTTLKDRNGEKQFLKVYVSFESDSLGQTEPNWSEYWLMGAKVGDGNSYIEVADYAEYVSEKAKIENANA